MANEGDLIQQGIKTEYFSTGWMALEFGVALYAGITAGSILLVAFGLDSFLEIISGGTLIWRLKKEVNGASPSVIKRAERRSLILVGTILLALAVYVVGVSLYNLVTQTAADTSLTGLLIASASVILMPCLTWRKRRLGQRVHSAALIEDGLCNITCAYMAGTVLLGALLTALFNWWWADSLAALVLVYFIASEGTESLLAGWHARVRGK